MFGFYVKLQWACRFYAYSYGVIHISVDFSVMTNHWSIHSMIQPYEVGCCISLDWYCPLVWWVIFWIFIDISLLLKGKKNNNLFVVQLKMCEDLLIWMINRWVLIWAECIENVTAFVMHNRVPILKWSPINAMFLLFISQTRETVAMYSYTHFQCLRMYTMLKLNAIMQ